MKPLAIDLYCGLGGWTDGLLAEGWDVVGFDIERHVYGEHRYPAQLVIWTRAKAKAAAIRADETGAELERLNRLFNACFRIQREACEAAGRHIPMVVENVRGAIPWVGRSRWNFGSFHIWGDVPALMPMTFKGHKVPSFRFDGSSGSFQTGVKAPGMNWSDQTKRGQDFTRIAGQHAAGIKSGGDWFNADQPSISRMTSSKSPARKLASAMIAKIPEPLSRHIARVFYPLPQAACGRVRG